MKFTLELNAYELREAIRTGLLDAAACLEVQETVEKEEHIPKTESPAVPEVPAEVPTQPQQPVPQVAVPQQPVQAMQTAPAAVPVQAISYTAEQLGLAAMQVADSKGHQVIEELLQRFGVAALTQLAKEQYGAFAAELRNLGAKL